MVTETRAQTDMVTNRSGYRNNDAKCLVDRVTIPTAATKELIDDTEVLIIHKQALPALS